MGTAESLHWRRLLADDSLMKRTTVADGGAVAGNIGCWTQDGLRLVGCAVDTTDSFSAGRFTMEPSFGCECF